MKWLTEKFADPPLCYRPVPFWFWNNTTPTKFNRKTITHQIRLMYEKGLGGFVIFNKPPYGFTADNFLGKDWFQACRFALDAARQYGMRVWINDGFDFPPGGLGGRMRKLVPEAFHRQLICKHSTERGNRLLCFTSHKGDIVSAIALKKNSKDLPQAIDILEEDGNSKKGFRWHVPPGQWEIFVVEAKPVTGKEGPLQKFPSYLDPEVNRVFINNVYEVYHKNLREYFGNPLIGFFSDCDARRTYLYPWSRKFDERFSSLKGYSIRKVLPALWYDFGGYSQRIRRDYRHFLSLLYAKWFKNNYRWCRKHGLLYTYHTSDTGPFTPELTAPAQCKRSSYFSEGRFHEVNMHADFPGTDHELLALTGQLHFDLHFGGKQEDWRPKTVVWGLDSPHACYKRIKSSNKTFGDVRAKFASSVAHLNNRQGAMCEAFAATNWGVTLDDLRWITNWQAVQGITMFVPHAFFLSMAGRRKEFAPPNHFRQSHLWEHYKHLTDYMGRLGLMLSGGRHVAEVAVLDPAMSLWSGSYQHNDTFFYVLDSLNHSGYDYDVVSEETLQKAKIEDSALRIHGEVYRVLVLPAIPALDEKTAAKIRLFVKKGGKIISVGPAPKELDLEDVFVVRRFRYCSDSLVTRTPLVRRLETIVPPDVLFTDRTGRHLGFVHFLHVYKEKHDIYFLANLEGDNQSTIIRASFRSNRGRPQLWDPSSGGRRLVEFVHKNHRTEIELELGPRESVFVVFGAEEDTAAAPRKVRLPQWYRNPRPLDSWRIEPLAPNILPLTVWWPETLKTGSTMSGLLPWPKVRETDRRIKYRFHCHRELSCVQILIPRQIESWPCYLNGVSLDRIGSLSTTLLDDNYCVREISALVRKGENEILLDIVRPQELQNLEYTCPYLQGQFRIRIQPGMSPRRIRYRSWYHFESYIPADVCICLSTPDEALQLGDWTSQGFPFYSGTMRYTTRLMVSKEELANPVVLDLGDIQGIVSAKVNGRHVGNLVWRPYQIQLEDWLRPGENSIVLDVSNTLANRLEEYPHPSGIAKAKLFFGKR